MIWPGFEWSFPFLCHLLPQTSLTCIEAHESSLIGLQYRCIRNAAHQQGSLSHVPSHPHCSKEKITVCRALGCEAFTTCRYVNYWSQWTLPRQFWGHAGGKEKYLTLNALLSAKGWSALRGRCCSLGVFWNQLSTRSPSVALSCWRCNCNSKIGMTATSEGLTSSNPDTWKPDAKVIHLC